MQLAFTTVDEFYGLLEQRRRSPRLPRGLAAPLPSRQLPARAHARALVADVVESDERFAWESDVHVGLATWRARRRDLADVAFVVVDLETTGARPGMSKITEIGAVRIEGLRQVGVFETLVNPQRPIPPKIVEITGITPQWSWMLPE